MITGLAHICFLASDLERSIAFYRDVLGFTPAFEFRNDQGEKFGQYLHMGGRNFLELFTGAVRPAADGQAFRHICLEVDDIRTTVADLTRRGVKCTEIKMGGDQSWQSWFKDPDGNDIELHQYTAESQQRPFLK